jgi:hypothetical protein
MADDTQDKKDNGAPGNDEAKPVAVKKNTDGPKESEQQRHARVGAENRAQAAEEGFQHPGSDAAPNSDINMYSTTAIGREGGAMTQGTGTMHLNRGPNVYPLSTEEQQAARFAPAFSGKVVAPGDVQGDRVRMFLPVPVLLTVAHGQQVRFPAGEQDVPLEYSTHDYLRAHGAKPANEGEANRIKAEADRQARTREKEKINAKDSADNALQNKVKPVAGSK